MSTIPRWTMADRMRKSRMEAGLTAQQIAAQIGISRKSVTNYETGATHPLRPILAAWALVTGVPAEWIESGDAPFPGGIADRHTTDEDVAERHITALRAA